MTLYNVKNKHLSLTFKNMLAFKATTLIHSTQWNLNPFFTVYLQFVFIFVGHNFWLQSQVLTENHLSRSRIVCSNCAFDLFITIESELCDRLNACVNNNTAKFMYSLCSLAPFYRLDASTDDCRLTANWPIFKARQRWRLTRCCCRQRCD